MFCLNARSATLSLLCLLASAGCGSDEGAGRLAVHPASGKVTFKGAAASGVLVVLHPAEGSSAAQTGVLPSATTDKDGSFQLTTYEQNDGAPAGAYIATIQWYQSALTATPGRPAPPAGFARPVDRLRGKYKSPDKSPWQMTIIEGKNVLQPIEIK